MASLAERADIADVRPSGEGDLGAVLLSGVTRLFGVVPAVIRVDLRVAAGEVILITGANGAGKSTLLRLIATAISPTYGSGEVLGFDLHSGRDMIRQNSEFLGHHTRLYDDLTASENLRFVCALQGMDTARVPEVLDRVGLTYVADERVRGYSAGMRQRVAVARVLLRKPELLLLDEPYAGLDADAKDLVDEAVLEARAEGRTVILSTHEPTRRSLATRILVMEGGRVVADAAAGNGRTTSESSGWSTRAADGSGNQMALLRQSMAVAGKDLRIEIRGRHIIGTVLPFVGTLLIALGLSLGPGRSVLQETAPGLLWLVVLFASVLAFRGSYQADGEDGALEGLLLAPIDAAALFVGKVATVTVELLLLEAVAVVLVSAMFGLSLGGEIAVLAAAFLLGTVGLAAVGCLFGVLHENPRARESVFPLLVLPLVTPVLVAGVRATAMAATGRGGEAGSWLGLLAAFDLVFIATGILVFGYLLED